MKAKRVVFDRKDGHGSLEVDEIDISELKDGEILGRIIAATICGSDLHTISGKRKEATPSVLGHEGVIEIVQNNRKGSSLSEGEVVTFQIADCCRNCEFCQSGLQQKCQKLFKYGHARIGTTTQLSGCYATHVILSPGTHVTKLPDSIPRNIAAPLNCALATMVNAVTCAQPRRKEKALIQGAGLLGIYACVLLKESGFKEVYCSDVNQSRLDLVKDFGGLPTLPKASASMEGNSVDLVIEVCGVPGVFQEGIRVLKPGGSYVLVGLVHPDSKLDITGEQIIRKCLTITGVHNYSSMHLDKAVEFLSNTVERYPYARLVSPPYELSGIHKAVAEAEKQTYLRVLIEP